MRAGQRRTKATFERRAKVPDGRGNFDGETWSTLCEARGSFAPGSTRDALSADRLDPRVGARFEVLSTSATRGVRASDRVRIGGETYQIRGPGMDPDGRGRTLIFTLEGGAET